MLCALIVKAEDRRCHHNTAQGLLAVALLITNNRLTLEDGKAGVVIVVITSPLCGYNWWQACPPARCSSLLCISFYEF